MTRCIHWWIFVLKLASTFRTQLSVAFYVKMRRRIYKYQPVSQVAQKKTTFVKACEQITTSCKLH